MRARFVGEVATTVDAVLALPAWLAEHTVAGVYRAAGGVVSEDGFFALRLVYEPDYGNGGVSGIHTLLELGPDARVYFDGADEQVVMEVDGDELRSNVITFTGGTELTVEVEHTEERRRVRVRGAASGDGPVDADPIVETEIASQVYVLGSKEAAEETSTLVALRPIFSTTFAELAERRLLSQNDPDGALRAVLAVIAPRLGRIHDVALALRDSLDLDHAVGASLDTIGSLVGLPRYGFADDRYRVFLGIQVELLLSAAREDAEWTGTCPNLLRIARRFIGETSNSIVLTNSPPYAYQLDIPDLTFDEAPLLVAFLKIATYAAVLGVVTAILAEDSLWDGDGLAVDDGGIWGSASVVVAGEAIWGTVLTTE
jgi:hypothetical protein